MIFIGPGSTVLFLIVFAAYALYFLSSAILGMGVYTRDAVRSGAFSGDINFYRAALDRQLFIALFRKIPDEDWMDGSVKRYGRDSWRRTRGTYYAPIMQNSKLWGNAEAVESNHYLSDDYSFPQLLAEYQRIGNRYGYDWLKCCNEQVATILYNDTVVRMSETPDKYVCELIGRVSHNYFKLQSVVQDLYRADYQRSIQAIENKSLGPYGTLYDLPELPQRNADYHLSGIAKLEAVLDMQPQLKNTGPYALLQCTRENVLLAMEKGVLRDTAHPERYLLTDSYQEDRLSLRDIDPSVPKIFTQIPFTPPQIPSN